MVQNGADSMRDVNRTSDYVVLHPVYHWGLFTVVSEFMCIAHSAGFPYGLVGDAA